MSDTDTAAGPLHRIAAAVDRERDPSSRICPTCGGPTRVVVREESAGNGPPVIRARKECEGQGCGRP